MTIRRLAPAAVAVALLLAAPGVAQADFGIAAFSAEAQRGGVEDASAGSHPDALDLDLAFDSSESASEPGHVYADGDLRELRLSLPTGFLAAPVAVPVCSQEAFHTPRGGGSLSGESCPDQTQVGVAAIHTSREGGATRYFGLYNLAAPNGVPEAIGLSPYGVPIELDATLRPDATLVFGFAQLPQRLDVQGLDLELWGTPWNPGHDGARGDCLDEETGGSLGQCKVFGAVGAPESQIHSYLTLPAGPCGAPLSYSVAATSWQGGSAAAGAEAGETLGECLPSRSIGTAKLRTDRAAAATGLVFDLQINDGGGLFNEGGHVTAATRDALVALPEGLTINPSLGAGLGTCSEADFAREGVATPPGAGCPNPSKIGEVTVLGLLGSEEPVHGSVYLATPHANPAGALIALYVVISDPARGIFGTATGELDPDPRSGRLVARFSGLPKLHYTDFTLSLREGQRAALISPPACGEYRASMELTPWSDPGARIDDSSRFLINSGEGGGPCPGGGLAPFAPALLAGSLNPQAGAYTPYLLRMSRADGEQEFTSYSAKLPPGLLGKIAGIPFCSDAAIAAATAKSGVEELNSPSCPAASRVGGTLAGYGVGGTLAWAPGALYLAGPYHGAPLSLVAIDSALVGPFDLGVVVVRQAIRVDPESAQVSLDAAGSDPIPHILDGIPLHLREIRVAVDRPGFTVNPTSCDVLDNSSTLTGAGADPFSSADDVAASSHDRYQAANCGALGFGPRLSLRLRGGNHRGTHPSLRAVYRPAPGGSALAETTVRLPASLFVAQAHLRSVCTQVQLAAEACPAGSRIGSAAAATPLLEAPMRGPVFLVSSAHTLPDMLAVLHGRGIEIRVRGRLGASHGGLKATFSGLPDAPLESFTMTLPGGRHGLLEAAANLCAGPQRAAASFRAQDNATAVAHPRIGVRCGGRAGHGNGGAGRVGHSKRGRGATQSDVVQQGGVRVDFSAGFSPKRLPRRGTAPISVSIGGRIFGAEGTDPPQLRRIEIALNSAGRIDYRGLPACRLDQIQPSTTKAALAACGEAKVGTGSFSAKVAVPGQAPFPSSGKVIAFNGVEGGRPVIFAHVFGTDPLPTSYTVPLVIGRGRGTFGTVLRASLPRVTGNAGFVTGIELHLARRFRAGGRQHSYLSAGCPAPAGFSEASFPLARASFAFAGGATVSSTLVRSCKAR